MLAMLISHSVWIHVYSKEVPTPADAAADVGPFPRLIPSRRTFPISVTCVFRVLQRSDTAFEVLDEDNIHPTATPAPKFLQNRF